MFKVINPGMLTTVQDLGRTGYQKYGLPVSGAADPYAHRMANILVGNHVNEATLEVTLMGLHLQTLKPGVIALTGGDLTPTINHKPVDMWRSIPVDQGDVIRIKGGPSGCRAYLAVHGGIDVPEVFGSQSTDTVSRIGGIAGRALEKEDVISVKSRKYPAGNISGRRLPDELIPAYSNQVSARVILGPQADAFTQEGLTTFLDSWYTVSTQSDRMACRLEGPKVQHEDGADIASEGMFWGAVQIPENGLPILFQAGRSSIGGYTKIAGVIAVDLPLIAQLKPGDQIRFKDVSLKEAHDAFVRQESMFSCLTLA